MTTATTNAASRALSRRQFLRVSALAASAGLVAYSAFWDRHHLELIERTIRLRRLPEAFHGLRIAQVSDIHYDEFTEPYFVREMVRRINALNPDIVVLTGDFVTEGPLPAESVSPQLSLRRNSERHSVPAPPRLARQS